MTRQQRAEPEMDDGPVGRRASRWRARVLVIVVVSLLASACTGSKDRDDTAAEPSLALQECDHSLHVACKHQAAVLTVAVPGTGTSLVYSSERAPGRHDRPSWDQTDLGLGGWSLDVIDRYDTDGKVVLQGGGGWRLATPVASGGDETAIATYDGRRVFVYDGDGQHVRTVDAVTNATLLTIDYDADGRLSTVAGTIGDRPVHVEVVRADDGAPRALIGADGARTELALDDAGHLSSVFAQSGRGTFLVTTSDGLVTSKVDPAGYRTAFTYDADGRLRTIEDPDGRTRSFTRTASAGLVEVVERAGEGVTSTYRAEATGDGAVQRTFVAADGTKTVMDTADDGSHRIVRSDGTTISIGSEPDPRWGAHAPIPTPLVETRPDGTTRHIETRRAVTTAGDKPLEVTAFSEDVTEEGGTWTTSYDPTARTITLTDPAGRKTIETVDAAGRVVRRQTPGQPDEARTFDETGLLVTETRGTAVTQYAYDPQTGTKTITRPDGRVELERVDSNGFVVRRTDPSGAELGTDHDANGRLTAVRPPKRPPHTLGTSPAGLPTGYLAPPATGGAAVEVRSYDTAGRLATIEGPGDRSASFTYDAAGRPTGWQSGDDEMAFAYDDTTGLVASGSAPGGVDTAYRYSGATLVGSTWSGPLQGGVISTLDGAGRTATETVTTTDAVAYDYDETGSMTNVGALALDRDPVSGLTEQASLGAVTTVYIHDADGRLASATTSVDGSPVLGFTYERDVLGRVAAITEDRDGVSVRTVYTYDAADQLATVDTGGVVSQYIYDANGNRVTVTDVGVSRTAVYDDRDRLVQSGTITYDYAPDGSLAHIVDGDAITTFAHDVTGALRSVQLPSGASVTYLVDASGQRVGRMVDGALVAGYLYRPDGRIVAELDGEGTVVARFAYDDLGHLAWVRRDGGAYRVVTDHLGSPQLVVDSESGEVVQSVAYDPWGAVRNDTAPGFQPFGFAGGLIDPDTKLVRFGARDYDPAIGRWTSTDPTRFGGGDSNLYRYASGDPVNYVDPSGAVAAPAGAAPPAAGPVVNLPETVIPVSPNFSGTTPYYLGDGVLCIAAWCNDRPVDAFSSCLGLGCTLGDPDTRAIKGSCALGYCSAGPGGFTCVAVICTPPTGFCSGICSRGYGDPHLQSADGTHFDFQAAGEYVIATSGDGDLDIQARQESLDASADVAHYTALAVNVAGDRVGTYADRPGELVVNGEPIAEDPLVLRLPKGGLLERHNGVATVEWPDGSRLGFYTGSGDFAFSPSAVIAPTLRGLLGHANGDPSDDRTGRDGVVLGPADPDLATKLYTAFGDSWRVTPEESLFDYGPGESTATFALPGVPKPVSAATLDPAERDAATSLCRALGVNTEPVLSDCVLDVAMTGDLRFAVTAAAVAASGLAAGPPETGERAPAATHEDAGSFELGDTLEGEVGPGSSLTYTFELDEGIDGVVVVPGEPCGTGTFQVLDEHHLVLAQTDVCEGGRLDLPDPGTYEARMLGGDSDEFSITVEATPRTSVEEIDIGDRIKSELDAPGERHVYRFDASAGEAVFIDTPTPAGSCDIGVRVLAPNGEPLLSGGACLPAGRVLLDEDGTYELVVETGLVIGPYQLALLESEPDVRRRIELGETVEGSIERPGGRHILELDVDGGGDVVIKGLGGECAIAMRPWDPGVGPLQGLGFICSDLAFTAPAHGRVEIVLEVPSDPTTGRYSIRVEA